MRYRLILILGLCLGLGVGCAMVQPISTQQYFRKDSTSRTERDRDIAECHEKVTASHYKTKYEDFEKCMQDKGYSLEWEAFKYGVL